MSNGALKTNNYLSPSEWKAILVKWIKTPNITKPNQRAVPRRLSALLGRRWSCSNTVDVLGWSAEDHRASSSMARGPGKGWWTELKCRGIFGRSLHHREWKSGTVKAGESIYGLSLSVTSEKLKLDSRVWICFPVIFPLDFSKCMLGVSQRLFFKNKSYILFFQTSFIFDIWLTYSGQSNPFCWSELWQSLLQQSTSQSPPREQELRLETRWLCFWRLPQRWDRAFGSRHRRHRGLSAVLCNYQRAIMEVLRGRKKLGPAALTFLRRGTGRGTCSTWPRDA